MNRSGGTDLLSPVASPMFHPMRAESRGCDQLLLQVHRLLVPPVLCTLALVGYVTCTGERKEDAQITNDHLGTALPSFRLAFVAIWLYNILWIWRLLFSV